MEQILLLLSFLINLILIIAVAQLFKQFKSIKHHSTEDLIQLFDVYLEEIKEENRFLQETINKRENPDKREGILQGNRQEERIATEKSKEELIQLSPVIEEQGLEDQFETSMESKILYHLNQGLSVDEIAKKLNCGKTEIELMLKLRP